jgi:Protein of unknown function, DUF547
MPHCRRFGRAPAGACALALIAMFASAAPSRLNGQTHSTTGKSYDETLDTYVRDGLVYYRALKLERARFDAYIGTLAAAQIAAAPRDEQIAFWLNAYNAIVLQTVIDHYPIPLRTSQYPAHSIRQIPGAFERTPHRVAGRTLTLDQIEQTVLPPFQDPRLFLALGRGSLGGGRLRSEAFAAPRLEAQLKEVSEECVTRAQCVQIDREANKVVVSAVFSWREKDFVAAYADKAPAVYASRSPVERAVLAFIGPKLLTTESEFIEKNRFELAYRPYDWSLNDLTGRGGR